MTPLVLASAAIDGSLRGASVALGNFDGVHEGHRAVVAAAASYAGCPVAAMVFEPHPRRYFQPDAPPFRIQSSRQRADALTTIGVGFVIELPFDAALAHMTDDMFASEILNARLGARHVAVGSDFRFGRNRMGDAASLSRLGRLNGFAVSVVDVIDDDAAPQHGKVSSSGIRAALARGQMADAARMLGRPWAIEGPVEAGFRRGRTIGYPTANVTLREYCRPKFGVYATRTNVGDGVWRPGASSCGVNPTVGALPEPVLETFIFDFEDDLYGRCIETQLVHFLRPEQTFDGLESLKRQIALDCAEAKSLLD